MSIERQSNTSAASLRCSYAEIRKWAAQGVDVELLIPQAAGSAILAGSVDVNPVVPLENTISDIEQAGY